MFKILRQKSTCIAEIAWKVRAYFLSDHFVVFMQFAAIGILLRALHLCRSVIIYWKFANTTSYKPLVETPPNLQLRT